MLRYLHSLSAFLFYLLAGGFFLAYVLFHNNIAEWVAARYLYLGQLPLLLAGLLYGGSSVYRSLQGEDSASRTLGMIIALPLVLIFLFFLFVRFLPSS